MVINYILGFASILLNDFVFFAFYIRFMNWRKKADSTADKSDRLFYCEQHSMPWQKRLVYISIFFFFLCGFFEHVLGDNFTWLSILPGINLLPFTALAVSSFGFEIRIDGDEIVKESIFSRKTIVIDDIIKIERGEKAGFRIVGQGKTITNFSLFLDTKGGLKAEDEFLELLKKKIAEENPAEKAKTGESTAQSKNGYEWKVFCDRLFLRGEEQTIRYRDLEITVGNFGSKGFSYLVKRNNSPLPIVSKSYDSPQALVEDLTFDGKSLREIWSEAEVF